jgi:outer membrane protein assembly factor BamB
MSRAFPCLAGLFAISLLASSCETIGDFEIERGLAPSPVRPPILPSMPSSAVVPSAAHSAAFESLAEWREWRGPARNGRLPGFEFDASDLPVWLNERWRVRVGSGVAGVVVEAGVVYVIAAREDAGEEVSAIDAQTGRIIWRTADDVDLWRQPFDASRIADGPLATPALADGRLYTVSARGVVQCFDAASGARLFRVDPLDVDGSESFYRYGHAMSPLVRNGRVFVTFATGVGGQLVALDARTGAVLWRGIEEHIAYGSLVWAEILSIEQIIVRSWGFVRGVAPSDGRVLWEVEVPGEGVRRDCATPLVVGDLVVLTNSEHGTTVVRVLPFGAGLQAAKLYRSGALKSKTASPIEYDGNLYGLHQRGLFVCVDLLTGERRWAVQDFGDHVSMIELDGRILALDERGQLLVLDLDPELFRPIARWSIGSHTWAHPAIDASGFYYRDREDLVALDLRVVPSMGEARDRAPGGVPDPH